MKRKAIALFIAIATLSLSTTSYAADTVQNAPTINSSALSVAPSLTVHADDEYIGGIGGVSQNKTGLLCYN